MMAKPIAVASKGRGELVADVERYFAIAGGASGDTVDLEKWGVVAERAVELARVQQIPWIKDGFSVDA